MRPVVGLMWRWVASCNWLVLPTGQTTAEWLPLQSHWYKHTDKHTHRQTDRQTDTRYCSNTKVNEDSRVPILPRMKVGCHGYLQQYITPFHPLKIRWRHFDDYLYLLRWDETCKTVCLLLLIDFINNNMNTANTKWIHTKYVRCIEKAYHSAAASIAR